MNDEPVVTEFKRLLCEVRDLAVAGERERCQVVLNDALGRTMANPAISARTALCRCIDGIVGRTPEPPAPEPMTVETLVAEAVETQRDRCAAIIGTAKYFATGRGDKPVAAALRDCLDAIMSSSEPPEPCRRCAYPGHWRKVDRE